MATKASAKKSAPKIEDHVEKMTKGFDEASVFGQQNMDAIVKSSELAAKAAEGLNEEITAFSKKSFDDSVAAAKDFGSAKTTAELLEKQSSFATAAFEGFVAQATKMSEMYANVAKEITAPLNDRATAATDAAKKYTA